MTGEKRKNKAVLPPIIKIAVVDDHSLFRAGIVSLLKDYDELRVVIEASDGNEFFEQLRMRMPHVVLLDIEMPGMNGIETTALLKSRFPSIKIIILTMHTEDEFIFEMITRGAHGFVAKNKTVDEVVDAIYSVLETGKYYTDTISEAMINGSQGFISSMNYPLSKITEKETQVLKLVCQQKTNKEIAAILGIGTRTVESHRNTLLFKTGTKNAAGLAIYAVKHKLISTLDIS